MCMDSLSLALVEEAVAQSGEEAFRQKIALSGAFQSGATFSFELAPMFRNLSENDPRMKQLDAAFETLVDKFIQDFEAEALRIFEADVLIDTDIDQLRRENDEQTLAWLTDRLQPGQGSRALTPRNNLPLD